MPVVSLNPTNSAQSGIVAATEPQSRAQRWKELQTVQKSEEKEVDSKKEWEGPSIPGMTFWVNLCDPGVQN